MLQIIEIRCSNSTDTCFLFGVNSGGFAKQIDPQLCWACCPGIAWSMELQRHPEKVPTRNRLGFQRSDRCLEVVYIIAEHESWQKWWVFHKMRPRNDGLVRITRLYSSYIYIYISWPVGWAKLIQKYQETFHGVKKHCIHVLRQRCSTQKVDDLATLWPFPIQLA